MIVQATLDTAWHVSANMRDIDRREILCQVWGRDIEAVARSAVESRPVAFACIQGNEPIAVGGVQSRAPGVGVAWLWATNAWRKAIVEVTRACRRSLDALESAGMHRFEAYSHIAHEDAHRWLKSLGFEVEGARLRNYGGPGEDFVLLARTKGAGICH